MAEDRNIVFKVVVDSSGAITGLNSVTKGIKDIDLTGKNAKASVDKLTASLKQVGSGNTVKNIKLTKTELGNLQKQVGGITNSSGAASAATLELGRAISDAPYGIRGVANNVSQFASQIAFMSRSMNAAGTSAIGLGGAMKALWKSIMGPLGILLAIQAVIAAIDYFAGSTKKAKEATEDMDKALKAQIRTLRLYEDSLSDSNTTLEERVGILKGLSALDKELAKALKEAGDDQAKLTELTKRYREQKELELAIKTAKVKLDELSLKTDEAALSVAKQQAYLDTIEDARGKTRSELNKKLIASKAALTLAQDEQNDAFGAYLLLLSKLDDAENKPKAPTPRRLKAFKQRLLDLSEETLSFNKREEKRFFEFESSKLETSRKYERLSLQDKYNDFKEKERLRLEAFLKTTKNEKEIADAKAKYNESILLADIEYGKATISLENAIFQERLENIKKFDLERALLAEKNKQTISDIEFGEDIQGQRNEGVGGRDIGIQTANRQNEEGTDLQKQALASIEFLDMALQSEFTSDELRAELLLKREKREEEYLAGARMRSDAQIKLDQLEIESKQRAVDDLVGLLGSASRLAGETTSTGKALAIASTTISTYDSAQKAFNSQFVAGDPTSLGRAVLAAAAATASGLLRVKEIMKVQVPNDKGSGSAPSGRTFDFNLVGSTGQNQLVQTIGGQIQQPIKAYVVGSEITNQQQFDSQIQGEATIG